MNRFISLVVMLSLVSSMAVFAQSPVDPFGAGYQYQPIPAGAQLGLSPEAKSAWESLSEKSKEEYRENLSNIIEQVRQNGPPPGSDQTTESIAFTKDDATRSFNFAERSSEASSQFVFDAPAPSGVMPSCGQSIEQFIKATYQTLLGRQPLAAELFPAENTLAQAQGQGSPQFLLAAQDVVGDIFRSPEYTGLGKTDLAFVYDLFEIYKDLIPGLALAQYWETRVQHNGRDHVLGQFEASVEFENILNTMCVASTYDADVDGLPDRFENQVANAFTPYYRVSGGDTDNFATFHNSVPQTVNQTFGRTPFSYFRVKPLGFVRNSSGTLFSLLRIDYLTLWDHDSGLVSGALCAWNVFGLDDIISALTDHTLDNERSAALVAAPVQGYTYSTNPLAYHAYDYYTAAHEGTLADASRYRRPEQPIPAGWHLELTLTRSKHATYTANVDGLPLTPWWIISEVFDELDYLYQTGQISYAEYLALVALAYDVFYACIVERFSDQGGVFANRRVNVGEPNHPINEAGFIQASQLNNKLTSPLWVLQ